MAGSCEVSPTPASALNPRLNVAKPLPLAHSMIETKRKSMAPGSTSSSRRIRSSVNSLRRYSETRLAKAMTLPSGSRTTATALLRM